MHIENDILYAYRYSWGVQTTHAKIDQVDATLFVEQRLNNVVTKIQQHLLN